MKERGIIFGAPMIKALLAGRKSVTRRIVKGTQHFHRHAVPRALLSDTTARRCEAVFSVGEGEVRLRCPYGFAGDHLWVRETWARLTGNGHRFVYRADGEDPRTGWDDVPSERRPPMVWTSPIFLPRAVSRLTLEVVDIRVERLHRIAEEDAIAEGIERSEAGTFYVRDDDGELAEFASARTAFEFGWDGLHAKRGGWAANPWVWRIAFKRVGGGLDA